VLVALDATNQMKPITDTPTPYPDEYGAGECLAASRKVYGERLKFGVAREQARKDLPLSTYTEAC
jgi:hypothetical protein